MIYRVGRLVWVLGVGVMGLSSPGWAETSEKSFEGVKERVYSGAQSAQKELPELDGSLLMLPLHAYRTLHNTGNFRESSAKVFHPMGVCAEATWSIDGDSKATGLLKKGTHAPALVRLSAGDTHVEWSEGQARIFGMAIKVFPSTDAGKDVVSSNLFTLDQNGLDGSERLSFLFSDPVNPAEVYFTNSAKATGHIVHTLATALNAFDSDPNHRPLYPFYEVAMDGGPGVSVEQPHPIRDLQFFPKVNGTRRPFKADFRADLLQYEAGEIEFEIVIPARTGVPYAKQIGVLTLGKPVVSEVCDLTLHFAHHPNDR